MKITNPITLDVARSNSYICLLAKQFDENSRFLIATLTNNGEPMIIPVGAAVTLRATRPDGEPVAVPGIINNDGTTTVEIDDYILEVVGSASLSIEVAIGDEILTSASFNLTIQRADGNGWLRVYVAAANLAAGNYYITIGDTPYAFTTTQAIPAGGSVYFASEGGTAQTRDASGNVLDASLPVSIASTGTELTSDVPTMSFLTAIAGQVATIEAEMSQKANIDGSYPLLHAGTADNLMTNNGATQAIPFIQEGTGKGNGEATVKAGGVLQLKKKLGNTVCVNQLQKTQSISIPGIHEDVAMTNTGTAVHIQGTASNNIGNIYFDATDYTSTAPGHTYILFGCPSSGGASSFYIEPLMGAGADWCLGYPKDIGRGVIFKAVKTDNTPDYVYGIRLYVVSGATVNADVNCYLVDLSLWFGSDANIPSDLLSHPENWGRYYAGSLAYNAGTLESADGSVLTSIGRNVWDEEWEQGSFDWSTGAPSPSTTRIRSKNYCECIPGATYYIRSSNAIEWLLYDNEKNFIKTGSTGNSTFTASANAAYFKICDTQTGIYRNDITISLYYSGESGYDQYYPYSVLAEVDTGSEALLGYDWKEPNGTIHRNTLPRIDLGTLNWYKQNESGGHYVFYSNVISGVTISRIICARYVWNSYLSHAALAEKEVTWFNTTDRQITIRDTSYADAASFKAAMSGVYVEVEAATPTTEQGTAFAENIPCDDFGSMYWTQTKGIPQGNEIFYPDDLKGTLESIVAALPSANGTYTFHATVTTAGVTFSWS